MALATLCWITFDGTKSLPDLQEIDVGQTQPGVKGATWQGLDYPLPMNAKGKLVSQDMYPLETFGGQIEVLNGYKVWKPRDEINGLTVYHGSNARVDAKISNENYQGIWFSPDFACAMGAGTNTAKDAMSRGGDVVIVEYVLKNSVDCKPFLLLGIGSRNNADILFENGFKTGAENEVEGFITMGRGSQDISVQLAEFCKNDNYCGWRSPYDQNEIFICSKCMKVCLKSTQTWYKVDKRDVQPSMEEVYWFPNQQPMNTVGSFVIKRKRRTEKDAKAKSKFENLLAGQAALYNGDTLAYYAYSIPYDVREVREESTPSHMTTKDESIPPKGKPNDENDASIPVVQNDCDQTIGPEFLYGKKKISTYNCKSRFLYGKKKVAWRVTPPTLQITEEDEDLDEPITPKSEPKTPKSDPKSKLEPSTPKSNPPTSESDPIIF